MTSDEAARLQEILQEVRLQLSRIHHDINNPLSIISGNVQLIDELSKVLELKGEFSGPIQDLYKAIEQLTASIDRLMTVRNILADMVQSDG